MNASIGRPGENAPCGLVEPQVEAEALPGGHEPEPRRQGAGLIQPPDVEAKIKAFRGGPEVCSARGRDAGRRPEDRLADVELGEVEFLDLHPDW